METVRELTYLGDRMSAGGGREAAVTVRTRCAWVKCRECGELVYGERFILSLKQTVNRLDVLRERKRKQKEREMGLLWTKM